MNSDERALFDATVQAAVESPDVDGALREMGWLEAFAAFPAEATAVLFERQGRSNATSSALEWILGVGSYVPGGIDPAARVITAGLEPAALRLARLALSHELIGASHSMLALARHHALERIQFGAPIASFQAVRHRLAEALVATETAQAAVDAAWVDGAPHHAAIAKALAGRGARTTAKHCQQVLAGVGFTMEHPFHRYFRRILVLDEQFGSARVLTKELGEQIVAAGALPAPVAL